MLKPASLWSSVRVAPTGQRGSSPSTSLIRLTVCKYLSYSLGPSFLKIFFSFGLQTYKKLREKRRGLLPRHPAFPTGGIIRKERVSKPGNRHFPGVSGDSRLTRLSPVFVSFSFVGPEGFPFSSLLGGGGGNRAVRCIMAAGGPKAPSPQ